MSAPPLGAKAVFKEVLRTNSGRAAIALLAAIVSLALLVPFYAPYDVVKLWNDRRAWMDNPPCAAPEWVQYFTDRKLPKTIIGEPDDFIKKRYVSEIVANRTVIPMVLIIMIYFFDYDYDEFPNFLSPFILHIEPLTNQTVSVTVTLTRPDKEEVELLLNYPLSKPIDLRETDDPVKEAARELFIRACGQPPSEQIRPHIVLFAEKGPDMNDPTKARVLKGEYKISINAMILGDPNADLVAKFALYGRIFGMAGTDYNRRDLLIGLLWGAPVALAFGMVAAVAVTLIQTLLGVISGYFGGRIDEAIQRATELMMVIPILPIIILIFFIYGSNIWILLALLVIFGVVGSTTKTVRSMVPSIKAEQYILAAKSYGASSWRIIFKHVLPRVLPYTFANIALGVPGYIFLEASLSLLGLGDPTLPTWGKILSDAELHKAAYYGYWWWVVLPAACIGITATAFALLGYAFDKVVNPRLREL